MDSNALQMMFNNGMQGLGAMQLGASNALAQQGDQAKLRELQMKNDQEAVMNPLNAQFRQGEIDRQQAELPGLGGISQQQVAKGRVDSATTDSTIAASIAKNGAAIGESGMQQMRQDAEKIGQVAAVLGQFDPSTHAALLPKVLSQYGMSADNPIVQQLMKAPDPSYILPALTKISDGMAKGTQSYLANSGQQSQAQGNKKEIVGMETGSHELIAAGNNKTAIEVAKIAAESRIKAADSRSQSAMAKMSPKDKIAYLSGIPEEDRTPTESAQLNQLTKLEMGLAAARGNAVAPQVLGQDTPQQMADKTANDIFPTAPKPASNGASKVDVNHMDASQKAAFMKAAEEQFDLRHRAATSSATKFDAPPPAAQYAGKRIKAPDGSVLRSDGKNWIKE